MKKADWKNKRLKHFYPNILGIAIFCIIAVFIIFGLNNVKHDSDANGQLLLEESLRHAAISCYAIEGRYPPTLDYLITHYKVIIDDEKYVVHYSGIFASNIMPIITVVPLENE